MTGTEVTEPRHAPRLGDQPVTTQRGRWVLLETNDHEPRRTVWVPETEVHRP